MSEIKFKRDTAFRKRLFVPESFTHPAKMDAQLCLWITERYTKVGETILDPMAGSGTQMLVCGLGRNVVLVELEEKFCKMCRDNWEQVKMNPQLGSAMGTCQIIQGDARNLEGLLVDSVITPPPYAEQPQLSRTEHGILAHPPDCVCNFCRKNKGNKGMIQGNRRQVDKIITSPPYAEAHDTKDLGVGDNDRADLRAYSYLKTETEGQIGNLPYGNVDKIITSPPFADARSARLDTEEVKLKRNWEGKGGSRFFDARQGDSPNNISNLPYGQIDKIVTSPPYEGSVSATGGGERVGHQTRREERLKEGGYNPREFLGGKGRVCQVDWEYSNNQDNIGNLKSTSYLEAMLQVYSQCHKVLKPEGLMILVTKNFIRNKAVIRLDLDTIKLCEQAGFKLAERHYRKLASQSFWRIIYYQKHPEVELIDKEDILVFAKAK